MGQVIQVLGALLILAAFILAQFHIWEQDSYRYLVPNLLGSAILTVDAWTGHEWGFLLLEGMWAAVSLWSILSKALARTPRARIEDRRCEG